MTDFPVTIFHNPACGTSRNVVSMVEAAGYRPEVVEYLKAGWTADQLSALFAEAGLTPREAMREKGSPATELGLLDPGTPEGEAGWCGRPGSNRHSFRNRILSPARLPVPPRPHRPVARFGRRAW